MLLIYVFLLSHELNLTLLLQEGILSVVYDHPNQGRWWTWGQSSEWLLAVTLTPVMLSLLLRMRNRTQKVQLEIQCFVMATLYIALLK